MDGLIVWEEKGLGNSNITFCSIERNRTHYKYVSNNSFTLTHSPSTTEFDEMLDAGFRCVAPKELAEWMD
jgi:hypothetical protein